MMQNPGLEQHYQTTGSTHIQRNTTGVDPLMSAAGGQTQGTNNTNNRR